jgi:hypothetical protein
MFCALADAKGEDGFKQEPHILRVVLGMCTDTNWSVRRTGAIFLYSYLKPLHDLKKGKTTKVVEE